MSQDDAEQPAPAAFVPGRHALDAYGRGGFRFAGMSHKGSILVLPTGIQAWPVVSMGDLTFEAFGPVLALAGSIDFMLVGTGEDPAHLPEVLRRRCREAGISVDPMPTGAAARTYNVLIAENRRVAAGLIAVA